MTQHELREGTVTDMLVRIASERKVGEPEVVRAGQLIQTQTRRPRRNARLFPDAPSRD